MHARNGLRPSRWVSLRGSPRSSRRRFIGAWQPYACLRAARPDRTPLPEEVVVVTIGIDAHKSSLAVALVDELGRELAARERQPAARALRLACLGEQGGAGRAALRGRGHGLGRTRDRLLPTRAGRGRRRRARLADRTTANPAA